MSLYDKLLWRGLIKDVSDASKAKNLIDGKEPVKFYIGFDPTGQSLTIGHLVQIVRMIYLEKHGHIPVVLIGGATGLIGDPRQTAERKLLTLEESLFNANKIKEQIKKYLPNAVFVNNYDWLNKIDLISFLRDYGKSFNVNYMLAKENVQARLEAGISYTEFSYMILQSIDWLHMYENMNVLVQFGGSDQWGNITSGLELIRKTHGVEHKAVGLSSPLLLKTDGTKFGKSESGAIWLDKDLTTPYEVYQYFLNTSDDDVLTFLKTLTLLEQQEIENIIKEHLTKPEARLAQKTLANELVRLMHGEDLLKAAVNVTESLFSGTFDKLTEEEFKIAEKSLDTINVESEIGILDALTKTNLSSSNTEARNFIKSGAIYLNDEKVSDVSYVVKKDKTYFGKYVILRRGRKKYSLIKFG